MVRNTISNMDDVIDSRDIIERIAELEEEREALDDGEHAEALAEWDEGDEGQELRALKALAEEAEDYSPDWKYGEALIRDSYFREYAEQLAEDIGAVDRNASWPCNCIDWDEAARQLKQDYTSVDFDGVEYWVRS